jgi:hypothetical protein
MNATTNHHSTLDTKVIPDVIHGVLRSWLCAKPSFTLSADGVEARGNFDDSEL